MTRRDRKPPRPQDDPAPAIWTALAVFAVLLWAAALLAVVTIYPARARDTGPDPAHLASSVSEQVPSERGAAG